MKLPPPFIGLAILAVLIGTGAYIGWSRLHPAQAPSNPPTVIGSPKPPPAATSAHAILVAPVEAKTPPLLSGAAALSSIDEASTTYAPSGIPIIARYLDHPDAEIRAAARDGLIRLGERGAAPYLREAAKKAATSPEAIALLQAADYLELPSWSEYRAKGKKASPTIGPSQNTP